MTCKSYIRRGSPSQWMLGLETYRRTVNRNSSKEHHNRQRNVNFAARNTSFRRNYVQHLVGHVKNAKKPNHFADMCRSRSENVRFADMKNSSDEEILVLESQREAEYPKRIYARLELAGEVVKFQLDSGAPVNVLPESIYRTVIGNKRLRPPQSTLFRCDNSELKTSGILTTTVRIPKTNQAYELDFYVVLRHRHHHHHHQGFNQPLSTNVRKWHNSLTVYMCMR